MRVSVIIPAINEQRSIGAAVESAQVAGADEVVVVDGGSQDGTGLVAQRLGATVVDSEPGRGRQLNAGARRASGEILLFLHADNRLDRGAIDQIRQTPHDARVLGAFRQRIDAGGIAFRVLEWGNALRARWLGLPYGDQGIFVQASLFWDLGGFPEVDLMEDVAFMRLCRRTQWPALLAGPLHVSPRRWRKHGIIRQTLRNWTLLTAYRIGVPPNQLARYYRRHPE